MCWRLRCLANNHHNSSLPFKVWNCFEINWAVIFFRRRFRPVRTTQERNFTIIELFDGLSYRSLREICRCVCEMWRTEKTTWRTHEETGTWYSISHHLLATFLENVSFNNGECVVINLSNWHFCPFLDPKCDILKQWKVNAAQYFLVHIGQSITSSAVDIIDKSSTFYTRVGLHVLVCDIY